MNPESPKRRRVVKLLFGELLKSGAFGVKMLYEVRARETSQRADAFFGILALGSTSSG
jgi:hypothetical protein